jgi:hypothetical protein
MHKRIDDGGLLPWTPGPTPPPDGRGKIIIGVQTIIKESGNFIQPWTPGPKAPPEKRGKDSDDGGLLLWILGVTPPPDARGAVKKKCDFFFFGLRSRLNLSNIEYRCSQEAWYSSSVS